MPSKDNGFSAMTALHLSDVEQLDAACNGGEFPAKRVRAAVRDSHDRAYVILEEGVVKAFAVFTQRRCPGIMHVERIAAVSKQHYQMILDGLYYLSEGLFGENMDDPGMDSGLLSDVLNIMGEYVAFGCSVLFRSSGEFTGR